MPIDISSESLLTITAATKTLPNRPSLSTLWRWIQRGTHGVKLETVLLGGRRYTSREALQRFFERTTAAADGTAVKVETPTQRRRRLDRVKRELSAVGI